MMLTEHVGTRMNVYIDDLGGMGTRRYRGLAQIKFKRI